MGKKRTPYQAHMSRELKGKMKGKTKSQRKAMFKAAAKSWKNKSKSPRKSAGKKSTSKKSSIGGARRVGKRGPNLVNMFFKFLSIGALVAPAAVIATSTATNQQKLESGIKSYTGWKPADGSFKLERIVATYTPFIVTTILGAVIPRLGAFVRRLMR